MAEVQQRVVTIFDLIYITLALAVGLGLGRLMNVQAFGGQLLACVVGFVGFQLTMGNVLAWIARKQDRGGS